jgi:hypothetical protein
MVKPAKDLETSALTISYSGAIAAKVTVADSTGIEAGPRLFLLNDRMIKPLRKTRNSKLFWAIMAGRAGLAEISTLNSSENGIIYWDYLALCPRQSCLSHQHVTWHLQLYLWSFGRSLSQDSA